MKNSVLIIEQVIMDGIESEEFRKNLHPKMITFAILGITNWSYQWFNPSGKVSVEELAIMFSEFILDGVHSEKEVSVGSGKMELIPVDEFMYFI